MNLEVSGIVFEVKEDESAIKYLMVKKAVKQSDSENKDSDSSELTFGSIFQIGSYIFYPLYLLPRDSLEIAYSITIHKAQGSGYEARGPGGSSPPPKRRIHLGR